jgi:hypothetical protein
VTAASTGVAVRHPGRWARVATHAAGALLVVGIVAQLADLRVTDGRVDRAIPGVLLYTSVVATGWLLAVRAPRNTIGWTLLFTGAFFTAGGLAQMLGDTLRGTAPGFTAWLYWFSGDSDNSWSWVPPVLALLVWIPLHFPDGSLPSPRWRWASWTAVALVVYACGVFATLMGDPWGVPNPTAWPLAQQHGGELLAVSTAIALVCFAAAVASLVVRYRRGDRVLRAQLRWVLWAVAIATTSLAISWFLPPELGWLDDWILVLYALIPIAIAVAVLRYRLYDIDRIISRTAAYAIVTVVTIGSYALVVLAASLALPALPSVGVALATLTAAAVFLPALRWIRRLVDRVFDRPRYDAQRVVDRFGERMRNGADPHGAAPELVQAVEQTLQPSAIGLWTAAGSPQRGSRIEP